MITGLYAGLLGILFVVLSVNIIRKRWRLKVALGDDQQPSLQRAIRAHGNFSEYVPLCLLLMFILENQAYAPAWFLHILGIVLILARTIHGYGLNQLDENLRFRMFGTALTFVLTALMSVMLCIRYFLMVLS